MKSLKLTVALVTALSSQAAFADYPCGNFQISTNQPNCNQPQPVYTQPQPQQAPCAPQTVYAQPPQQQAPAPVVQTQQPAPRYGYGFGFRARYNASYGYQQQPTYWQTRRAEAATPDYGRGLELGVRGVQDESGEVGAGLYLRAHQKGGQQRLALELSADAVGDELLGQGAGMLYLNPNGFIKPFGLLGGGLALSTGETVAQAGIGLDLELTQRLTVTGDVRAVESVVGTGVKCLDAQCLETTESASFLLGNIGISRKF
jgi:opacity protein-like surface antigen